jgi:hypothetical protein
MDIVFKSVLVLVVAFCLSTPVMAADALDQVSYVSVNPPNEQQIIPKDKDLARRSADFESFAKVKVQQLNRNHRYTASRMEITKQTDGRYRARYHQIDESSLGLKVRRSQSKSIPFVGVLSYKEQVFESFASSPDQFKKSSFKVVEVIPNRHIFSYQKGVWK